MDVGRFARPEVRPKNRFLKVLLEDSVINCLETSGVCLFLCRSNETESMCLSMTSDRRGSC